MRKTKAPKRVSREYALPYQLSSFPRFPTPNPEIASSVCTLTWWSGPSGYEVFFNRDELRTRGAAEPPAVQSQAGVQFIAPVDQPSGGTWLLANEHGLTLAILNLYERELPEIPGAVFRSRGLLLRSLADCRSLEEVADRLHREAVSLCNAFTMLGFDQAGPGALRVWRWAHDRESLTGPDREPAMPVCSSSFQAERVIAARKRLFAEMAGGERVEPELLGRYHHFDQGGAPSAETVLMRRPDARTLSISRVRVTAERVRFEYEEIPEDGVPKGEVIVTELARG